MCMNCKAERGRCSEGQPPSPLLCLWSERNVAVKYMYFQLQIVSVEVEGGVRPPQAGTLFVERHAT